jgi:hypothetical protein
MESDGAQILLGSGAVGALCAVATSWIKARFARTKIEPQPLEVKGAAKFVTCEECALKHRAVDERLSSGTRAFDAVQHKIDAVEGKMDANQRDVMNSIQKLNDRISPMAESCAENGAAIRILLGENLKTRPKP